MRSIIPALAAAALMLAACETTTAYAPAPPDSRASGFWDTRIEQHRFRVSYRGGDGAPPAQVDDYALLHAADVALGNGDDWFQIVDKSGSVNPGSSSSFSFGIGGGSFGRHGGSSYGLGTGVPLGGGAQLTTSLEIFTGKGPPPQGAYNAVEVRRSISARLPPPQAAR